MRDWQLAIVRLLITAVPLVIVLGLAIRAMQKANAGEEGGYSTVWHPPIPAAQVATDTSAVSCKVSNAWMNRGSGTVPLA